MKKICGIGINDISTQINKEYKIKKCYRIWNDMIRRCYDEKYHKRKPTYIGCTVCEEWLYFSNFKKWFDENYRWDLVEQGIKIQLDKDLLSDKNNKIYSPTSCIFLPEKINSFISSLPMRDSELKGVSFDKNNNKWRVRVSDFHTHTIKYLGRFKIKEEAIFVYKTAKRKEIMKVISYLEELKYDSKISEKILELC